MNYRLAPATPLGRQRAYLMKKVGFALKVVTPTGTIFTLDAGEISLPRLSVNLSDNQAVQLPVVTAF